MVSSALAGPLRVLFVCTEHAGEVELLREQRMATIHRATASDETPG